MKRANVNITTNMLEKIFGLDYNSIKTIEFCNSSKVLTMYLESETNGFEITEGCHTPLVTFKIDENNSGFIKIEVLFPK
jgi:hypothetical protein